MKKSEMKASLLPPEGTVEGGGQLYNLDSFYLALGRRAMTNWCELQGGKFEFPT